tara:strand:- start:510 stop:791 length:282 start_codon:yes stop_codon:yes gene_type:complete
MTNVIYKDTFPQDLFHLDIEIAQGSTPLHFALQHGEKTVWYEVPHESSENLETVNCEFRIAGTGHRIDSTEWTYLGTLFEDVFVWHCYYRTYK